MTKFDKELFDCDRGGYLVYGRYPERPQFVARFKYGRKDKAGFISFLIKHFSPIEYFTRLNAGETPVGILESKGYVSATVKNILKKQGFPQTLQGKQEYLNSLSK